ncbi:uncharacterized protein F5147DRAFT_658833 [Suillus discolor]|uniref:Uncharacterized protein n=1 Tax=Suillus discolor TaxID=1912936 RepID=A0A9P7ETK0_9AGAM|nr:uncharacterized protein F5147DRAFT_658833 [Suillus discolor]KAG2087896.1 hypothetical protein F5147DRAFT_658833 [Suillus discolor]
MARSASPVIMPQQTKLPLIKAEIAVLQAHLEDWRSVKGKERHQHFEGCTQGSLPSSSHSGQSLIESSKKDLQGVVVQPMPVGKPQSLSSNMARNGQLTCVLIEQNKARIREETGEMPGSEAMIVKWPEATKTISGTTKLLQAEVQVNVAETKGADIIEQFATEMFKQAGMRVFVMSAWQGQQRQTDVRSLESFMKTRNWDEIFMPEWRQYAAEQFDVQDDDVPQVVTSKKRMPRKLLDLEEDDDGLPMLPDTMGLKCGEQQHVIQVVLDQALQLVDVSFTALTRSEGFTGMCMRTDKVKAALPWGDLIKNQSDFFNGTYWPVDVQVVEPSKIDKAKQEAPSYLLFQSLERH